MKGLYNLVGLVNLILLSFYSF